MENILLGLGFLALILVFSGFKIVPEQEAWIVEKLGKFDRKLSPGLSLLIPFIEKVAYKHTLKEQAIDMTEQTAITKDNVTVRIDGVLYLRILDPVAASYGASNPYYAISQLAQTTMRSEIGKITLDKTFEERETLNTNIVHTINEAATSWGIQCMRYEIRDITPPENVKQAMELQVAAERQKRAEILESEGKQQAQINRAEASKREVVLNSEAAYTDKVNRAKGEAEAILSVAAATAESIEKIAKSSKTSGGVEAISLKIAEQYMEAFNNIAQHSNTIILPANVNDASSMITQALTIFNAVSKKSGEQLISNEKKSKK
jgi:regulator of protease activity HflC (stomatin/prohibitin superfamily)